MKENDLIELLRSTIESDAIISTLILVFHNVRGYEIKTINTIIQYGLDKGIFKIGNVNDFNVTYDKVEWSSNNNEQEVYLLNPQKYIPFLFCERPTVPKEFEMFIK